MYDVHDSRLSVSFLRYHRNMSACWTAGDNIKWSKSSTRYGTRLVKYSVQNRIRIKRLLTRFCPSFEKKECILRAFAFYTFDLRRAKRVISLVFDNGNRNFQYATSFRVAKTRRGSLCVRRLKSKLQRFTPSLNINFVNKKNKRAEKPSSLHLWCDDLSVAYRQSKNLLCSNNVKRSNDCFILTMTRGYLLIVFYITHNNGTKTTIPIFVYSNKYISKGNVSALIESWGAFTFIQMLNI